MSLRDAESIDAAREVSAVDSVAVTDQIPEDRVPGERFDELSAGPLSRRMFGDVEVNDAPPVMGQHEEHEQNAECNGGHGEEIDGAFPWDTVPRYLIRDRDGIYGRDFAADFSTTP